MFFIKKIFDARDGLSSDEEKPFLDHLEDLRIMVIRALLTLIIATISCFFIKESLLDLVRRPVTALYESSQKEKLKGLPDSLEGRDWELAKVVFSGEQGLTDTEKTAFRSASGIHQRPTALQYLDLFPYYRSARLLDDQKKQQAFVNQIPWEAEKKERLLALLKSGLSLKVGEKSQMVQMQSLKPAEGFMLSLKLAFFAGIIVSFPLLLFFVLQFIIPGLHRHEKKVVFSSLAVGFGLFLAGASLSYFFVIPNVLMFFHEYSDSLGISNDWRIGEYISFVTQFVFIFGLAFELPVVVMALVKVGLLDYEKMSQTRSYAIISILIIAAFITPTPDAPTLMLLAGPMIILYELCIWLAFFMGKKEKAQMQTGESIALNTREENSSSEDPSSENSPSSSILEASPTEANLDSDLSAEDRAYEEEMDGTQTAAPDPQSKKEDTD